MAKIVVVDDDPRLRVVLAALLEADGHQVHAAENAAETLQCVLADAPDLVVLDLNLPDLSGEDVMRVLKAARPGLRVLVLSSVAEIGRRVAVLESGAVDFVSKPFVNAELVARIRLRISESDSDASGPRGATVVPIGGSAYVDKRRRLLQIGSDTVVLSPREFTLLTHLLERRGKVCTRQELLADVWGLSFDPGTNVVDVYVRRLRTKLAESGTIETVRNVGYRLLAS